VSYVKDSQLIVRSGINIVKIGMGETRCFSPLEELIKKDLAVDTAPGGDSGLTRTVSPGRNLEHQIEGR
jgi:hypothetical protein